MRLGTDFPRFVLVESLFLFFYEGCEYICLVCVIVHVCAHCHALGSTCMRICLCMHACMHECVCACECAYACVCACVCMCVCTCVCVRVKQLQVPFPKCGPPSCLELLLLVALFETGSLTGPGLTNSVSLAGY